MADSSKFFRIGVLAAALLAASLTIVLWGSSGAEPAAAASSTIKSKEFFVETKDGFSIHVSEKVRSGGGTKKVPILLVHSLWTNSKTWDFPGRSVMDYLATNGYDVYALDLRGMGDSEDPLDGDYSTIGLLERVKDLEAVASFIKEQKRPPVVLGYSQGGALAGVLAASRPKLVSGVGLFSVAANGFIVPEGFQGLAEQLAEDLAAGKEDQFKPAADQLYFLDFGIDPVTGLPTISNEAFNTHYLMSEADSVRAILELASPQNTDFSNFYHANIDPSWSQIEAPALVVDGALDPTVGEERATALYDALGSENKDLIIFERNAHAWFLEDNYQATQSQAFDEFLAQFDK
jgi:pimeloyl-ACP methyl ester carboxylesterase